MALIELDQLLGCSVDELIALVKAMSADNCEQYARAILGRIDGPSFEQLIRRIVETAVNDGGRPPTDVDAYYFAVSDLFPHVAIETILLHRVHDRTDFAHAGESYGEAGSLEMVEIVSLGNAPVRAHRFGKQLARSVGGGVDHRSFNLCIETRAAQNRRDGRQSPALAPA